MLNANSLVSKGLYMKHLICEYGLSVLAVCETLLVSSVSFSFVSIGGFQIVRGDGSQSVRKQGCCLYVGDTLSFVQIEVNLLNVAAVLLLDLYVYDLAVYRPPSNYPLQDESLFSFISDFCVGMMVVILGDFNLPPLYWREKNVIGGYVPPREIVSLIVLACWV